MGVVQSVLTSATPLSPASSALHFMLYSALLFVFIICLPLFLSVSVLHPDLRRTTHLGTGGRLPLSTQSALRRRRRRKGNSLVESLEFKAFKLLYPLAFCQLEIMAR